MLARVYSCAVIGLDGEVVEVEIGICEESMPKPIFITSDEKLARPGITEVVETWEDGFRTDTGRDFFE